MNPAAAHRLLNAPTAIWAAYQTEHPHWGDELAYFLRAGSITPLAVTNNLRKLTDCMADPGVQPLLCDWLARNFVPATGKKDTSDRVQEGLGRCVRSLQLQALAQGQNVNILDRLDTLAALSGNPLESRPLVCRWMLTSDDIYTTERRADEYFSNGKSLGAKDNVKKVLSHYQKFLVEAMLTRPDLSNSIRKSLLLDSTCKIEGSSLCMAHALLWDSAHLSTPLKYALAYDWAENTSEWATRAHDEKLSPQKTRHWKAWALHAKTYLNISGVEEKNIPDVELALTNCPPVPKTKDAFDDLDAGVFSDTPAMLAL